MAISLDQLEMAIKQARKQGIGHVNVIVNSSVSRWCHTSISEASVSNITGFFLYLDGCEKDMIGYLKPQYKAEKTK